MRGTEFRESNDSLGAPKGEEATVYALPIRRVIFSDGTQAVISCWIGSWKERLTFLLTGRVWFTCLGQTHPPITIDGCAPPSVTES